MKIGTKLFFWYGITILLLISMTVYTIINYKTAVQTFSEYYPAQLGRIDLVGDLSLTFKKQVQEWKDILLRGHNPKDLKKYTEAFRSKQESVRKLIWDLKSGKHRLISEKNIILIEKFIKKYDILQDDYTEALKLYTAGDGSNFKEADMYVRGKDRGATDILDKIVKETIMITLKDTRRIEKQALSIGKRVEIVLIIVLIISIIIGMFISRSISKPIKKITAVAKEMRRGKLNVRADIKSKDEIGILAASFNSMTDMFQNVANAAKQVSEGNTAIQIPIQSEEDVLADSFNKMTSKLHEQDKAGKDRIWEFTAIEDLGKILREGTDLESVSNNICSFLADLLNVQMAAYYSVQENSLLLTGSYAVSKDKKMEREKEFEIGEGLVGQAVVEKDIITVTNIPANSSHINSAFCDILPTHITIQPFVYKNRVVGVIELGSFTKPAELHIKFLKKISELTALSLINIENSFKLQRLLEQAQSQAEELQMQQTELEARNNI